MSAYTVADSAFASSISNHIGDELRMRRLNALLEFEKMNTSSSSSPPVHDATLVEQRMSSLNKIADTTRFLNRLACAITRATPTCDSEDHAIIHKLRRLGSIVDICCAGLERAVLNIEADARWEAKHGQCLSAELGASWGIRMSTMSAMILDMYTSILKEVESCRDLHSALVGQMGGRVNNARASSSFM
jgi:hypothetical protein